MSTSYKETLNLPKTDFPMKASLPQQEPKRLERWEEIRLYEQLIAAGEGKPRYIFHDGPPYANGGLHLGTILNKILKDIVLKYKNMSGFQCEFIPGWDCHGLPIELEVDKKLGDKKRAISPSEKRKLCREHATTFIDLQRAEFKRLGVLARWDEPYITMSKEYEAVIAREFGKFVQNGGLYKGKKPISWCASCRTALAEAEVEYADHRSPSIYVKFQLEKTQAPTFLVIWTTTPWTIPANLAIALHPELPYVKIDVGGEHWIVAEGLLDQVMSATGRTSHQILATLKGGDLEHQHCKHPLIDRTSPIILSEHVTLEAGTGAVQIAPGHGQEDYEVGSKYGLDILAPVDNAGRFTEEVGLDFLVGLHVEKANPLIVQKLEEGGALVAHHEVTHSYPHCWRCKKAVIFRSTEQWFISMNANDLRAKALAAIQKVEWIPDWGIKRIGGMIEHRPDWCVSRQRLWGVPIVAVFCEKCDTCHTTPELVEKAAMIFEEETSDVWFEREAIDFLPKDFSCPKCGEKKAFRLERDILDVWFDSGVSYAAVLERQEQISEPADLYLEGSDQHRGWFHTSLLTSIGTRDRAPYKRVLTHGFVVDGEGRKYSKSAKNYLPPQQLIDRYGAEILRLWVAAEDYRNDIRFSDEILTHLAESYRKIRNTCRYLLGNLYDFHPEKDKVDDRNLLEIDRWALSELERVTERILAAYEKFEFHTIYHTLNRFCTVELSSFYLDILKDRLYAEKSDGLLRRSAQTVLWHIAERLVRLMTPILSFTAEEIWEHLPQTQKRPGSVFLAGMPDATKLAQDEALSTRWKRLEEVRSEVTKILEQARNAKLIGNSLQAKVIIDVSKELHLFLESFGASLADLFIVSEATFGEASGEYLLVSDEIQGLKVSVHPAEGKKCVRCWKVTTTVGGNVEHPDICVRCAEVLT